MFFTELSQIFAHLILTTTHEETARKGLIARARLSELNGTAWRDDCLTSFQVVVY